MSAVPSSPPLPWRAAIIDLDGTLVDTLDDFVLALGGTLAALGLPGVSRRFIARTVGKGSEHLLRTTLAEVGADAARYPQAWATYQAQYAAINGQAAQLYPGVLEGLQALRAAGLPLACVTNKPGALARALLERKGLAGFFSQVHGGDAFARKKPDPLPLIEACRALGSAPTLTLMVGDSRNDAEAAAGAGCPVVLMTYGYNHGEPIHEVPALAHLDRLDELFSALPG
ncbi:MAG: phosphoglycolate phosphatase [Burkholderiales bacterium]